MEPGTEVPACSVALDEMYINIDAGRANKVVFYCVIICGYFIISLGAIRYLERLRQDQK